MGSARWAQTGSSSRRKEKTSEVILLKRHSKKMARSTQECVGSLHACEDGGDLAVLGGGEEKG